MSILTRVWEEEGERERMRRRRREREGMDEEEGSEGQEDCVPYV